MEIYPPLPAAQRVQDAAALEEPLAPATWRLIVDDEPRSGPAKPLPKPAPKAKVCPRCASTSGNRRPSVWGATSSSPI
jgi:hypothetical protein